MQTEELRLSRVVNINQTRSVNSGAMAPLTLREGDLRSFADLPIGATFRMYAGKWPMRKMSQTTAERTGARMLNLAHEFVGDERCVIVSESE